MPWFPLLENYDMTLHIVSVTPLQGTALECDKAMMQLPPEYTPIPLLLLCTSSLVIDNGLAHLVVTRFPSEVYNGARWLFLSSATRAATHQSRFSLLSNFRIFYTEFSLIRRTVACSCVKNVGNV